jgi:glycosyltransferase involved in cell wall biosynthesis
MVRHEINGLLVEDGSPEGFSKAIACVLRSETRRKEMSAACRQIAESEYSLQRQARDYTQLYKAITTKSSSMAGA